jgi:O-antigen/teichoic acid export membrane protein
MNIALNTVIGSASLSSVAGLLSYFTTIYLARHLTQADFGSFVYALSLALVVLQLSDFAFEQCAADYREKKQEDIRALWAQILPYRVLAAAAMLGVSGNLFKELPSIWLLISLIVPLIYIAPIFEIKNRNIEYAFIKVLERAFILGGISLCIFLGLSADSLYLAYGLGYLACALIQFHLMKPLRYELAGRVPSLNVIDYVGSYWAVYLSLICHLAFGHFSRLLSENSLGVVYFGAFYISLQIVNIFSIYQTQLERHFRPRLVRALRAENAESEIIGAGKSYLVLGLVPAWGFAVTLYFFSGQVVSVLFGEKWGNVSQLLEVLAFLPISVCILRLVEISGLPLGLSKFNLAVTACSAGALILFLAVGSFQQPLTFPVAVLISHFGVTAVTGLRLLWCLWQQHVKGGSTAA